MSKEPVVVYERLALLETLYNARNQAKELKLENIAYGTLTTTIEDVIFTVFVEVNDTIGRSKFHLYLDGPLVFRLSSSYYKKLRDDDVLVGEYVDSMEDVYDMLVKMKEVMEKYTDD